MDVIYLNPEDNTCVTARTIEAGQALEAAGNQFSVAERIKIGHKIAVRPILEGEAIRKYGQIIGYATQSIAPGEWVHSHNLKMGDTTLDYEKGMHVPRAPQPIVGRTFRSASGLPPISRRRF
jgi:altronate hydrolase